MKNRINKQCLKWEDYLFFQKILPGIIIFEQYLFSPSTEDEMNLISDMQETYWVRTQWLEHLTLVDKPIDPDLCSEGKLKLKTTAELQKLALDLISEIMSRRPELQKFYRNPMHLWFVVEIENLNQAILQSGLITRKGIYPISKQVFLDNVHYVTDWLNGKIKELPTDDQNFYKVINLKGSDDNLIWYNILNLAHEIASEDPIFANSDAFKNYLKQFRVVALNHRKESNNSPVTLIDGRKQPQGRKANSAIRRKHKGF